MAVEPPNGFVMCSQGDLEHVFSEYPKLTESLGRAIPQMYDDYVDSLEDLDSFEEFSSRTRVFAQELKTKYARIVRANKLTKLLEAVERTVVCCYLDENGLIVAHLDLVPKNVKVEYYINCSFIKKTH